MSKFIQANQSSAQAGTMVKNLYLLTENCMYMILFKKKNPTMQSPILVQVQQGSIFR